MRKINMNRTRWLIGLTVALLLSFACAVALADVAITEENFEDPIFRAYVSENFDTGEKDGILSDEEIRAAKEIQCGGMEITSFKGVEYLTSLTYLDCAYNQLKSLDVSKNTLLTSLFCYNCQLTSLDVRKNTSLVHFWCFQNKLSSLNLSNNTLLERLACEENQLTSLDVSKNTRLTLLNCASNKLTALDISKCTYLDSLVLDHPTQFTSTTFYWETEHGVDRVSVDKTVTVTTSKGILVIPDKTPVENITLNQTNATLTITDKASNPTLLLSATVSPANATDKSVTWSSNNKEVAFVDQYGRVTAAGYDGKAIITCTANDGSGAKATCTVTVKYNYAESIRLPKQKTLTRTGKQKKPTVKLDPIVRTYGNTDSRLVWTSKNKKIATVDKNGKVTGLKAGTTTITCTTKDEKLTASCKIIVEDAKVKKIKLTTTKKTINKGKSLTLGVKFTPESPLNQKVTWSTSDKKIATVGKTGIVKAKKKGTCVITCSSVENKDIKATCTITVK